MNRPSRNGLPAPSPIRPPVACRAAAAALSATLAQACAAPSLAAETCRFTGTTDYDGRVAVTTQAVHAGDTTQLDVTVRFEATVGPWLHLRYLVEEISAWRAGALTQLDANTRTVFAGRIVRQQWDEFRSVPSGLQGYRIQGKRPAEFRRQFPAFAQHWDLAAFGQPWLADYAPAAPARRPDLDVHHQPATRSPFALAFYWVRFLRAGAQRAEVFLPGFKADKLADVVITPVPAAGRRAWRAALHHPFLSAAPLSTATAQVSPDAHLQILSFELHSPAGSASGSLHAAGCDGSAAP